MKLKEKLSKEVLKFKTPCSYKHEAEMEMYIRGVELGFIIGFEKARDLILTRVYLDNPRLGGLDISSIGEEEVEE